MALVAAVPADAAPRQTDVFCGEVTFNQCTDSLDPLEATEFFDCRGTLRTDDVTCTSVQTGEVFDCEFVTAIPEAQANQYFCTEIDEQQPGQQQPAAGGGGGPITQETEQDSEAGEINQTFKVS